jgi:hypothetical protein
VCCSCEHDDHDDFVFFFYYYDDDYVELVDGLPWFSAAAAYEWSW